jgi:acyl-homoserine-lactone acylase
VAFTETTENAFRIPFDEADPINTPSGLIINAGTRQALGEAIKLFQDRGVALDATLGELQYVVDAGANDERIPMHGGLGREGIFNVAQGPGPDSNGAYTPISTGPTYMQSVTFDEQGPVVEALLALSQAADITRPFHRDQTRRYSAKDWIRLPFSPAEIAAQAISEKRVLRE